MSTAVEPAPSQAEAPDLGMHLDLAAIEARQSDPRSGPAHCIAARSALAAVLDLPGPDPPELDPPER